MPEGPNVNLPKERIIEAESKGIIIRRLTCCNQGKLDIEVTK